jgi:hypothetical protein
MRVWPTIIAACCVISFGATVAQAQQTGAPLPQYVFNATTALSQDVCYWAGVPYSVGARILAPQSDRDPHVIVPSFICRAGTWAQD